MARLPLDWLSALGQPWNDPDRIDQLVGRAYQGRGTGPVLPSSPDDLFRAFELTPFAQVRAVIVGQDPYPDANLAHGVAFSAPGAPLPKALTRIFSNLEASKLATTFTRPSPDNGDLSEWAGRGILLINAALTYEKDQLRAHCGYWKPFLGAVLVAVSKKPEPIPFLLLGGKAVDLSSSVRRADARVLTGHPTPRSKRTRRFPLFEFDRPFVRANTFLTDNRANPIDWTLI
ncbi:uracil-DNA glycosylase [Cryobacterium sp. TMT1-21]|uniref:uracil-DNA glycosylase n=1 Tax=Cryobacterium sp. TMT1-21 TaxID=1259234 RepID=UPI00106B21C9|nr:uracil-DNA glycosylase [Cryobacterium sp. TMT1-21]